MKYICFPFRLQCSLPQFTDIHSANFMLYCISLGYDNVHTLCLHRILQVKLCPLTENDTMMCYYHTNSLLTICAWTVTPTKIFVYLDKARHSIESLMRTGNVVIMQKTEYMLLKGEVVPLHPAAPHLLYPFLKT